MDNTVGTSAVYLLSEKVGVSMAGGPVGGKYSCFYSN